MPRMSMLDRWHVAAGAGVAMTLAVGVSASAQPSPDSATTRHAVIAPSVRDLMLVLDARIQRSKPADVFKRTVLFRSVRAGEPSGNVYPFVATLTVHDYSPGWPPNNYYGKTCLGKIESGRYTMFRDRLREWAVEGRTTNSDPVCTDNPAARVSAFPVDSLTGTRVGSSAPVPKVVTQGLKTFRLKLGEYACILPGGRLAANRGFRLKRDNSYTDALGARGGTYAYEPFATTLAFRGGFLDGQTAKYADGGGFVLSPTLTCSPWQ